MEISFLSSKLSWLLYEDSVFLLAKFFKIADIGVDNSIHQSLIIAYLWRFIFLINKVFIIAYIWNVL